MRRNIPYPKRLALASLPTPIHPLSRFSVSAGGPQIWVKRDDLTGSLLTGNKVRKLEFTLSAAIDSGHDVFITCGGVQSNHCRATALCGAQLGIPVHLILRGEAPDKPDGNLLIDYLAGATIDYYEASQYQRQLSSLLRNTANHYRSKGYKPYIIPTGASNGIGVWGYFAACAELANDFKRLSLQPDLIITATGSGGTQAGLSLGARYFELGANVLGMAVCDDEDYFQNKVKQDLSEFYQDFATKFNEPLPALEQIAIHTNDHYVGKGYGIVSDEELDLLAELARTEGILLDPVYTGKAFYGLVSEIKKGHYAHLNNIVFIHTGGSYAVFPYKDAIMQRINN